MPTAFLFPGQGAQEVGMGKDLSETWASVKDIFERADATVGYKLSDLCFEGPAEKLNATDIQQPAIFTASVAALEAMRASDTHSEVTADHAAGLSLGEYTAYYAAGALDFESALTLVQARGRLMQQAAEASDGAMLAVIGIEDEKVLDIADQAREGDVLVAANFNCPGQVVLSGHRSACERAMPLADQAGALKTLMLDVAGAFHSPLMQSAADQLREVLEKTEFAKPTIPVIANVDCRTHDDPAEIRENLYRQVISATHWGRSMQTLLDQGVDRFYELGPKKTLRGFLRRIHRKANVTNISSVSDLA